MDKEERQSKLKAGREALKAFQQKKKKKKGRSKKHVQPASDTSTMSEPPSLIGVNDEAGSANSLGGNESPIPFDDFGHPSLEDNLSLPQDPSSRLSTSLPIMPNIPQTTYIPAPLDHQSRPHIEHSEEPDGTADRHDSPQPPSSLTTSPRIAELEQQISSLVEAKQQLQNELNTVLDQQHQAQGEILQIRKNQDNAVEIAKREVAGVFESQISSLQYSLMQSESAQQELEKQLYELKSTHSQEVESLVRRQEEIRETLLHEKDQKHAEHIARLTEKFASQMETTAAAPQDIDEQEAERLKMIKMKMREMFEEEKKQIQAAHEQEKASIQQSAQKQIEEYRAHTEQLANSKLQEVHAQFMSAHQVLLDQKNQADVLVQDLNSKLTEIQQECSHLSQERSQLQERYDQLSESHLAELEKAQHASNSLESRLNDWKDKASKLETRLHTSETESQTDLETLRQENEAALNILRLDYDERLRSLQQLADDYQLRLSQAETDRERVTEGLKKAQKEQLEKIRQTHTIEVEALNESIQELTADRERVAENLKQSQQEEFEKLKQDHYSEVSALNESIRELTTEKGSLEAAEEHMMSVQKQLENFRKQELSYQNRLDEKERDYRNGIEVYKQQFETEKTLEIGEVTAKFDAQIKSLEEEISNLTASVESGDTERRHQEKVESLKSKHKRKMAEVEGSHEQELKSLRDQLEQGHREQMETTNRKHCEEVAQLRDELTQKSEFEQPQLRQEIEASKQREIEQLVSEHRSSLEEATKSLASDFTSKSNERITTLEQQVQVSRDECSQLEAMRKDLLSQLELAQRQGHELNQTLQRTNTEMERLSQDCDRYQKKSKSLEVDLSISQSAHEQDKQQVSTLQQEITGLQAQTEELTAELEAMKQSESTNNENEELLSRLTNDLATKNVALADLQAQNDTLNTEVFSLTQKCPQLAVKSNSLQEQLETSWGANEEIESLKRQVSELVPFRDESTGLKEKIEMFEEGLKSKDEAVLSLQAQLEQATQYATDSNARSVSMEREVAESAKEVNQLKQTVAMKNSQERELQGMIGDLEHQVEDLTATIDEKSALAVELNGTIENLKSQLCSASENNKALLERSTNLEAELQQSQQVRSSGDDHRELYERLQKDFESVCVERDQLSGEVRALNEQVKQASLEQSASWQEKVTRLEGQVQDLQSNLAGKESELVRVQNEFAQKLRDAEFRVRSKQSPSKEKLGSVVKEKSALEETLTKARLALTEKLAEKSSLEKELSIHRSELERRLAEKQHLEELLVEKSRFEQELQNQKEQLQNELEVIESKMKIKENEHKKEKKNLLGKVKERDGVICRKTREMEGLKTHHKQTLGALNTRHKKELDELSWDFEARAAELKKKLEEQRLLELAVIRRVIQGDKKPEERPAIESLPEPEVKREFELVLKERLQQELLTQRGRLEQEHTCTPMVSMENQQQYQAQLEQVTAAHNEEIRKLKSQHEADVAELGTKAQDELRQKLVSAQEQFEQELADKISEKERQLLSQFEQSLSENNSSWETKLQECLEKCRLEMATKHKQELEQVENLCAEEKENAIKANMINCEHRIEALEVQHQVDRKTDLEECELGLREEFAEQLSTLESDYKQRYGKEIEQLLSQKRQGEMAGELDRKKLADEIDSLHAHIENLEGQLRAKEPESVMQVTGSSKEALLEKELELQAYFRTEMAILKAVHSETENTLRTEYESKIAVLESELEEIEEQFKVETAATNQPDLDLSSQQELLEMEVKHREEIASVQSAYEQKLHEFEARYAQEIHQLSSENHIPEVRHREEMASLQTHWEHKLQEAEEKYSQEIEQLAKESGEIEARLREEVVAAEVACEQGLEANHTLEIDQLKEEYLKRESKLLETHEQKIKELLEGHDQEKEELTRQHQHEISELQLAQSKRLSELQAEVLQVSSAYASPQSKPVQSSHMTRPKSAQDSHMTPPKGHMTRPRSAHDSHMMSTDDNLVGVVQSDTTLISPSKMQQFRAHFKQQREQALAEQREKSPSRASPQKKAKSTPPASPVKQKSEYEKKLAEIETKMAADKNAQIELLKKNHERDLKEREKKLKSYLEDVHLKHIERVQAECEAEKNHALEVLRQELDETLQKHISELKSIHDAELQRIHTEHATTEAMTSMHTSELAQLKSEHSVQIDTLKAQHATELEAIVAQYTTQIEALQEQHTSEMTAIKAQQPADLHVELQLKELRTQLVQEHMAKFKNITEKLQQIHQAEVDTLKQEKEGLASTYEDKLQLLRGELETEHEREVAAIVETHKNEMKDLCEGYEAQLGQAEVEHAHRVRMIITQQEAEENEGQQLEHTVRQELSRMSADVESKLSQLETERQGYSQRQAAMTSELEQLRGDMDQARVESNKSREEVERLTVVLQARETEVHNREHEMEAHVSRLEADIRALVAERDALQSTVNALHEAVQHSLQLSTVVNTVLGVQPMSPGQVPPAQVAPLHSHSTLEESSSALSERLLTQQGVSPEGSESSHSTRSTPTPPPHTPPAIPPTVSTATSSTVSFKQSSDWTNMKQTPSVDSGIISQQASTLHSEGSTLIGTPSTVTVATPPVGATSPSMTTPSSEAPSLLSIVPLASTLTTAQPHTHDHTSEDLDDTAPSFLSVSLMTATGSPSHEPLTVAGHDDTMQSLSEQPLIDLSVLPLDTSSLFVPTSQSILDTSIPPMNVTQSTMPFEMSLPSHEHQGGSISTAQPLPPNDSALVNTSYSGASFALPNLPSLHAQITAFHGSVATLVERYTTLLTGIDERSTASHNVINHLQTQLESLSWSHAELQQRLEGNEKQATSERKVHSLKEELKEKQTQMEASEDKIKTLVQQLEGRDARLEQVSEAQALLKTKEKVEQDLKDQLVCRESVLTERVGEIEHLKAERDELSSQVEGQLAALQQSATEALQLKQESHALKEVNRQLRDKQEQSDIKLCAIEEKVTELTVSFQTQLRQKQEELNDLQDVRDRLSAKEEQEEMLIQEREDLMNRLSNAEHQLATQSERWREEEGLGEKEQRLLSQLKAQGELCETLRVRLQETQSSLHLTQQECNQVSSSRTQLQLELHQLREELQRRETLLQTTLAERVVIETELEAAKEELTSVCEERDKACSELEEVRGQMNLRTSVSLVSTEQESILSKEPSVHQISQQMVDSQQTEGDRSSEIEQLTLARDQLENRVAALEHDLRDKEEQYHQQCSTLEGELARVRRQLTEHAHELELRRSQDQRERSKFEELRTAESDLRNALHDLAQKLSVETQLKASLNEEVTVLRGEVERGQRSREKALAEAEGRHEQELQTIVTEHAQKLNELQLAHLEALHRHREEMEAKHAGEMTYLKLHHQEQVEELQTRHNQEVERLVSQHHSLLLALDNAGGQSAGELTDDTTNTLLLKIAELAPVLAKEAQEVSELCKLTGQHVQPDGGIQTGTSGGQVSSLETLVRRLREVVQDIGAAKDVSGVEDWRRDLLQAVEGLLDHQRGVLATTLSASALGEGGDNAEMQQLLQDQLSQHSVLLQQLHTADRESLLAEIRALRATLDTMRQEQRQQNRDLLAQLQANGTQTSDSTHLQIQLQSTLAKLSQLERELSEKHSELASKHSELLSRAQELKEVRGSLEGVREREMRLEQEVEMYRERVAEAEGSLASAQAQITALKQELETVQGSEASLGTECSREKVSSAQLRDSLTREQSHNRQLSAQVEHFSGQRTSSARPSEGHSLQANVEQLQTELSQANAAIEELREFLTQKQNELNDALAHGQEETSTYQSALRAKEDQLTQTTDKLLQEKLLSSQVSGEVRALKDRVSTYQREIELKQEELESLREHLHSLQRDKQSLQAKLEISEQEQMHINGLKEESELNYQELVSSLQDQLRRSRLLRSTPSKQVATDGTGVRELVKTLLQQEQLYLLSQESLKADKEHLEREIRGLQKEVDDWKHLARTPGIDVPSRPSPQVPRIGVQDGIAVSESGTSYEQTLDNANSKIARLYALYRQAESHRKALVFQKKYLLCQVDAFYQTQQAALQMMSDMGAPVEVTLTKAACTKVSRPYTRFRTIGRVVLATLRFQYVRRRKIEYLQAKMSRLTPSPSVATTFGFSPPQSHAVETRDYLTSSQTHKTPLIPPPKTASASSMGLYTPGNVGHSTLQLPTSTTSHRVQMSSVDVPLAESVSKSKSAKKLSEATKGTSIKHRRVLSQNHLQNTDTAHYQLPKISKQGQRPSTKRANPLSSSIQPSSSTDPQLVAYIKGLEKLQARLSKTKL